jgi:hypothetical protein
LIQKKKKKKKVLGFGRRKGALKALDARYLCSCRRSLQDSPTASGQQAHQGGEMKNAMVENVKVKM